MSNDEIRAVFDAAEAIDLGTMGDAAIDQDGPEYSGDMPPEGPLPPLSEDDTPEARAAVFPLNDYGNGQRLMEYYGADILYVPRLGWYRWEGRRWCADEDEIAVRGDAQKIAARILQEIKCIALEEWQREALELWRECKPEFSKLEKMADKTAEQAARKIGRAHV